MPAEKCLKCTPATTSVCVFMCVERGERKEKVLWNQRESQTAGEKGEGRIPRK